MFFPVKISEKYEYKSNKKGLIENLFVRFCSKENQTTPSETAIKGVETLFHTKEYISDKVVN